jgi:hypothetical protein
MVRLANVDAVALNMVNGNLGVEDDGSSTTHRPHGARIVLAQRNQNNDVQVETLLTSIVN